MKRAVVLAAAAVFSSFGLLAADFSFAAGAIEHLGLADAVVGVGLDVGPHVAEPDPHDGTKRRHDQHDDRARGRKVMSGRDERCRVLGMATWSSRIMT